MTFDMFLLHSCHGVASFRHATQDTKTQELREIKLDFENRKNAEMQVRCGVAVHTWFLVPNWITQTDNFLVGIWNMGKTGLRFSIWPVAEFWWTATEISCNFLQNGERLEPENLQNTTKWSGYVSDPLAVGTRMVFGSCRSYQRRSWNWRRAKQNCRYGSCREHFLNNCSEFFSWKIVMIHDHFVGEKQESHRGKHGTGTQLSQLLN